MGQGSPPAGAGRPEEVRVRYDRAAALHAIRKWVRTKEERWLHRTFELMYPLLSITQRQRFGSANEHDREDMIQFAALRLWQLLLTRSFPRFDTDGHWNVWTRNVCYNMLCGGYAKTKTGATPTAIPEIAAGQAWHVSRYGSPSDAEDRLFLAELPLAIEQRIRRAFRLKRSEWLGARYVLRQLFEGRLPVPYYLEHALHIRPQRIPFLVDYVTLNVRVELLRMYTETKEFISHPISMVIRSEEL